MKSPRVESALIPALTLAALLLVAVSGCGRAAAWNGLFKIGVVAPFEGQDAPRAMAFLQGAKLAVLEANQTGGVRGQRIELVALDEPWQPDAARYTAREMAVDPLVVAVVGHFSDGSAVAALPEYQRASLPLFSPATAASLSGPGFVRTGADERHLVEASLDLMSDVCQAKRVMVLAEEGASGDALVANALAAAAARGLTVKLGRFPARAIDLAEQVRQITTYGSQATLFYGDAEQAAIWRESLPASAPAIVFIGDGYRLSRLAGTGTAVLYYATPLPPLEATPPVASFTAHYQGSVEFAAVAAAGYRAIGEVLSLAADANHGRRVDRQGIANALDARQYAASVDNQAFVFRLDGNIYPGVRVR